MPVTAALPTTLALSNEAYEVVRDAVKHYSTMARNAITSAGLPNTPTKTPQAQQRRMACTHLTMKRQYGDYRCMVCRRVPDVGWVYICTQDDEQLAKEGRDLSEWTDGMAELDSHWLANGEPDGIKESHLRPVTQLSPWIEQAIIEGHYTSDQILLLRQQRQNVNDKIAEAVQNFNETEAPLIDAATSLLPFPTINQTAISNGRHDSLVRSAPNPTPFPRIFPYCEHRACHNCRSTFRDRTWLHFNEIFEDSAPPTIHFENDNRPLGNPAVVAWLGMREPKRRRQRPLLHSFDSMNLTRARSGKRNLETANSNTHVVNGLDVADQAGAGDLENKGLRHTLKRAFRDMLTSRRASLASNRNSVVSTTRPSRRARLQKEAPWANEDSAESDLGLWRETNEKVLREASRVRLPGRDGHDGLDRQSEEVEVEDGVAVTEEGVEEGKADVIMSV